MIHLDASFASDLDWKGDVDGKDFFYLDFGLHDFNPYDSALFNAHLFAVEEFGKQFPSAKQVLFARIQDSFSKFMKIPQFLDSFHHEIFCAQIFSDYLHRLASILPESAQPVLWIEKTFSFAESILLFCLRRFEYFHLNFKKDFLPVRKPTSILISIPQDEKYDPLKFEMLFSQLKNLSFTCIPEEFLNEHWDEVNHLIVDPDSVGEIGKRMLYGFEAAGGEIISTRGPFGFSNETSLEKFLTSE